MDKKVKQHRFCKYLWLLHTPKKLICSHLLRPGSGSGPRRPDPTKRSGSDRIRIGNTGYLGKMVRAGAGNFYKLEPEPELEPHKNGPAPQHYLQGR
jgi:hypothetical protein